MEFKHDIKTLVDLYQQLTINNTPQSLKEDLCDQVSQFQALKRRKVTLEEMLALQEQNKLLEQIKSTIRDKQKIKANKDVQETFYTNQDIETSISFNKIDHNQSFLLQSSSRTKLTIPPSSSRRISRRGSRTDIDVESMLTCIRNNFGFQASETLKSMINSNPDNQSTKYKSLYQKQKTNHQVIQLHRLELSQKVQKLNLKIEQMEKDIIREQNQRKNALNSLTAIQAKESRLLKLQTKLLVKQKMLQQQQKHLQTLKASVQKEKEIMREECEELEDQSSQSQAVENLKISLQKRRKSCKQYQIKLEQQFITLGEFIYKLEDSDPYGI